MAHLDEPLLGDEVLIQQADRQDKRPSRTTWLLAGVSSSLIVQNPQK